MGSAVELAILMDKYRITRIGFGQLMFEYFIDTLEGRMRLSIGDWIATGVNGEHWAIADDVFKETYAEVSE